MVFLTCNSHGLIVKIVFSPLAHAKSGDDLHPVYTFKEMETVHATFRPGYHMCADKSLRGLEERPWEGY